MRVLSAKLFETQQSQKEEDMSKTRKLLVGGGDRSEKIRTYNFPQGRVSDHRINLTLHKLDYILDGDLDELNNELYYVKALRIIMQPSAQRACAHVPIKTFYASEYCPG